MRYSRAVAALLAMSPAAAVPGNEEPRLSDEQACVGAATNASAITTIDLVQRLLSAYPSVRRDRAGFRMFGDQPFA
jgi:hypothetical protein